MTPKIRVYDEGEVSVRDIAKTVADREIGINTIRSLLDVQAYLDEGILEGAVDRQQGVVERSLEEDVFAGKVYVPGWFVNEDDELSEEYGSMHPGGTLEIEGLVEDYSEKAFRIVARKEPDIPGLVYEYEWTFLPKSVVTLVRLTDVGSLDTADQVSQVLASMRTRNLAEWSGKTYEEMLEKTEN